MWCLIGNYTVFLCSIERTLGLNGSFQNILMVHVFLMRKRELVDLRLLSFGCLVTINFL